MADQSIMKKMVAALLSGNGGHAAMDPAYVNHVRMSKAMGEQPMTPQQFAASQQAPQPAEESEPAPAKQIRF